MNWKSMKKLIFPTLLFVAMLSSSAQSQTTGILEARVIDQSTGEPVPTASVRLRRISSTTSESLLADSAGLFQIAASAGRYEISVEHLGYAPRTDTVAVIVGETTSLSIELRVLPVALDSIEAKPRERRSHLGGFWDRRERNIGFYFTREDIEKARPMRTADLFRRIPGAKVLQGPNGLGSLVTFERYRRIDGTVCPAMMYVDGRVYVPSATGLDDFLPTDIEALEAYSGSSRLPPEFNAAGKQRGVEPRCGVIVIWTRGTK